VVPASVVLGCPVHRVQAPEPGPDELVAVRRDTEFLALGHAVQWHCERRVLLNGNAVVFR
jgi:formyltetrahydrofolate hydrolase